MQTESKRPQIENGRALRVQFRAFEETVHFERKELFSASFIPHLFYNTTIGYSKKTSPKLLISFLDAKAKRKHFDSINYYECLYISYSVNSMQRNRQLTLSVYPINAFLQLPNFSNFSFRKNGNL